MTDRKAKITSGVEDSVTGPVCADNRDVTVVRRVGQIPTVGTPIDIEPGVLGVLARTHEFAVSTSSNVKNVKAVVRTRRQELPR